MYQHQLRKRNFCIKFMFHKKLNKLFIRVHISVFIPVVPSRSRQNKKAREINSWPKFERVITSDNVGSLLNRTLIRKRLDNDEKREKKKRGLKRSGGCVQKLVKREPSNYNLASARVNRRNAVI